MPEVAAQNVSENTASPIGTKKDQDNRSKDSKASMHWTPLLLENIADITYLQLCL